jgi:hypothetical protein
MAVEHIQAMVDAGNAVMAGVPDLITQIKAAIEVAQAFPEKAKGAAGSRFGRYGFNVCDQKHGY